MFAFHAAATQISAVTTGRLDLQAGDIVKLNIKEKSKKEIQKIIKR